MWAFQAGTTMQLDEFNRLDADTAERELLRCCGSRRWAREMAGARPFASVATMTTRADAIWASLGRADVLEAFASHPRIGERSPSAWASEEQNALRSASVLARARLAEANREYEARFGYIFIVRASGKRAADVQRLLERRLMNDATTELAVAVEEQRKITRLRLTKLVKEDREIS